ncbi:hypothetical protein KPH14_009712 [Odynerus spinipes]|uniref:Uncharacterized protein n=1 Tax=Odynerus spinipes TaxID=1348599 RepID=A0AAD9RQ59_9HYME|nr:hypothetical protein KPH14_009712 [Odynerus spinipes]
MCTNSLEFPVVVVEAGFDQYCGASTGCGLRYDEPMRSEPIGEPFVRSANRNVRKTNDLFHCLLRPRFLLVARLAEPPFGLCYFLEVSHDWFTGLLRSLNDTNSCRLLET